MQIASPFMQGLWICVKWQKQFAELIAKLVMGWSRHVSRLIKNLDPHYPNVDKAIIQFQLDVLNGGDTTKIDVLSWKSLNSEKQQ